MDDRDVLERIGTLVSEEHALRDRSEGLSDAERSRLQDLEERLDQCWDLLRQRRARRHADEDPGRASPRPVDTVEHYDQ